MDGMVSAKMTGTQFVSKFCSDTGNTVVGIAVLTANDPHNDHDANPSSPADDSMTVCVSGFAHDLAVDELCGHVGVDDTNDNGRYDDKGERSLLVGGDTETAESRCSRILAEVAETNRWWDDEQESRDTSKDSESLREVLWLLHLGDEGGEQDLRNPEEGDVQDGVHGGDEGRAGWWHGVGLDWAELGVVAVVAVQGGVLDAGEDHEQQDGDAHACS